MTAVFVDVEEHCYHRDARVIAECTKLLRGVISSWPPADVATLAMQQDDAEKLVNGKNEEGGSKTKKRKIEAGVKKAVTSLYIGSDTHGALCRLCARMLNMLEDDICVDGHKEDIVGNLCWLASVLWKLPEEEAIKGSQRTSCLRLQRYAKRAIGEVRTHNASCSRQRIDKHYVCR